MTSPIMYSSAAPFLTNGDMSNIVGIEDQFRVRSYDYYENAYYNRPENFQVTLRGEEDDEQKAIFLPSGHKIIEAVNRFLAVDFDFALEDRALDPSKEPKVDEKKKAALEAQLKDLFKREKLYSKFASQRRMGLVRGDAMFHITADDSKLPGKRIAIHELDPRSYFPIADTFDPNRLAGCHLVDLVQDPRNPEDKTKRVSRVQTYRRVQDSVGNYTGTITSELTLFEVGKWDERNMPLKDIKVVQSLKPPTPLDPRITSIPVYHWRNKAPSNSTFGLSELAGIETLINGLNQSISDEDLTLVMQGLGMYWTDAAPPLDEEGEETDWTIGPKQVIEVGNGQQFGRVTGVSSVAPFLDHMKYLDDWVKENSGVGDVASGRADVTTAESGIALVIQLLPLLSANKEKELEILVVMDQMLFDLTHMWFPAYEQLDLPDCVALSVVENPIPQNREATLNEVVGLVSNVPQLILLETAVEKLAELGYAYTDTTEAHVQRLIEQSAMLANAGQPFAPEDDGGDGVDGGEVPTDEEGNPVE